MCLQDMAIQIGSGGDKLRTFIWQKANAFKKLQARQWRWWLRLKSPKTSTFKLWASILQKTENEKKRKCTIISFPWRKSNTLASKSYNRWSLYLGEVQSATSFKTVQGVKGHIGSMHNFILEEGYKNWVQIWRVAEVRLHPPQKHKNCTTLALSRLKPC